MLMSKEMYSIYLVKMDPLELHKLNVIAVIFLMTFGYPIDIYKYILQCKCPNTCYKLLETANYFGNYKDSNYGLKKNRKLLCCIIHSMMLICFQYLLTNVLRNYEVLSLSGSVGALSILDFVCAEQVLFQRSFGKNMEWLCNPLPNRHIRERYNNKCQIRNYCVFVVVRVEVLSKRNRRNIATLPAK
ncbi:hypothetical protein AGLY_007486 [Aphis glycines]|uniref:Uncharacterized protein n=1 Tax=Aphis glycines TaxID=307491 RepID=A0A6G0TM51_APHGL|nr:hypothetical protein AGLY_007486 [Aphis glycines]